RRPVGTSAAPFPGGSWVYLGHTTGVSLSDSPSIGQYLYTVQATDCAGNVSARSADSTQIGFDNLPPSVTSIDPGPTPTKNEISLSWTATDDGPAGILDGDVWQWTPLGISTVQHVNPPYVPSGPTGNYIFSVSARDRALNTSSPWVYTGWVIHDV